MTEQHIDVSELEPPEPLEKILDSLADLPSGQWLRVTHRRDPVPLYRMLKDMGYRWHTERITSQHFEIHIWPVDMDGPSNIGGLS